MSSPVVEPTLQDILEDHAPQDRCPGCPFGGPKVGSKGDPKSPIVFVAESPGIEEVKQGEPLVGPSGKIFHQYVPDDGSVYTLNALECRPMASLKNEGKMNEATACCNERLIDKIQIHPRRIIVAMGNAAVRSLTGNYGLKITQIRGRLIPSPLTKLGIMPVVHVAALMRGTGSYRQWAQDMQYAMELGLGAEPRTHTPTEVEFVPEDADQRYVDELFTEMLYSTNKLTGDIETSGFDHINDRILSIGVTPESDVGVSYCFYPHQVPLIKHYLEHPDIEWCWHNGKFDIKFLRQVGVWARVDDDTMLMSYAQDEMGGVHDLETVAADVLDAPDYKHMIQPYLPTKRASYENIPYDKLGEYQAIDTGNTAQIRKIYRERVRKDPDLEKLYTRTLIPASEMLSQVETNGIYTDPERLDENEVYFQNVKEDVGRRINEMLPSGYSINPGSPKQVSDLLFRRMKLPNRKKGSTDASVLNSLYERTEHPILRLILEHRGAVKMYGTYVKGIRKHVHPETQRVHATYLLHGTRTGRLACRDPNLQNPPRMPQIRGTFVAAPGYELVEVDLSQAELRSLAALSGDDALCAVFLSGRSPHKDLAVHLFEGWSAGYERYNADPGNPELQIYKEQYTRCKNVNFGIIYGVTPIGLALQIKDTKQVAAEMLQGWRERYPDAWGFIRKCRDTVVKNQVITTCFGRKKRVQIVSRQNLNFLKNEAANFPHQSIASDITLHAAIRTEPILRAWGVRIVNLVHDAILMEVPITPQNETRGRAIELVSNALQQVPKDFGITKVPFETDAEWGHRWGSLKGQD